MEEKSLYIKLDKHKEVNDIIAKLEQTKEQATKKIELMKQIMIKEKDMLENFEESLKKTDAYMQEAKNLLNEE
jgi:hypothetical protein